MGVVAVVAFGKPISRLIASGGFPEPVVGWAPVLDALGSMSFLWHNVIGCAVVVVAGMAVSLLDRPSPAKGA
jgi:hypothetical protein